MESLYEDALYQELKLRNIPVQSQVRVPVTYKNYPLREAMRLDLLVGQKVIVEIKATENEHAVHKAQVLTYLRLTDLKLGLVLNFGQGRLIDGLTRVVNNFLCVIASLASLRYMITSLSIQYLISPQVSNPFQYLSLLSQRTTSRLNFLCKQEIALSTCQRLFSTQEAIFL